MGITDKLFGGSAADAIIAGALIGDKLDERNDRAETIRLLKILIVQQAQQAVQTQQTQQTQQTEKTGKTGKTQDADEDWNWMWGHPSMCRDLCDKLTLKAVADQAHLTETAKLRARWAAICERAEAVGIVPSIGMPRDIGGDIVGTLRALRVAMDSVVEEIKMYEREAEVERKFGAK